MNLGRYK